MDGNGSISAATHFGRQLKKERLAHGWGLRELSQRTGIDAGHLSRVENGKRPPTEVIALACDDVFPERRGWFMDWYTESREWSEIPATFRSWQEYEDKAGRLHVWSPGIIHGLLQTENYARALLITMPKATDDVVATRLTARMERQRRTLGRPDPPASWFIVDELSLYRLVGSAEVMAAQLRRLLNVAAMPGVTVQVLPAVAHPATAGELIITDDAAYVESLVGGAVLGGETVSSLMAVFDSLRGESYRVSESVALIERLAEAWESGASPLTAARTAAAA
jgi:transcriptional regulator with XRE-family HTH domain